MRRPIIIVTTCCTSHYKKGCRGHKSCCHKYLEWLLAENSIRAVSTGGRNPLIVVPNGHRVLWLTAKRRNKRYTDHSIPATKHGCFKQYRHQGIVVLHGSTGHVIQPTQFRSLTVDSYNNTHEIVEEVLKWTKKRKHA